MNPHMCLDQTEQLLPPTVGREMGFLQLLGLVIVCTYFEIAAIEKRQQLELNHSFDADIDKNLKSFALFNRDRDPIQFEGKGQVKFFKINRDQTELKWKPPLGPAAISRVDLASVMQVLIGPRSNVFKLAGYSWKTDRPWNCFTLLCMDRTIDIECHGREQFVTWVLGLQQLIPLTFRSLSRGEVNWYRALFKTAQVAQNIRQPIPKIWINLARHAQGSELDPLIKMYLDSKLKETDTEW